MKKTLLSALTLVVALCANAETKTWDFTNWSDATKANLGATDSNWSDIEKEANQDDPSFSVNGNCYWQVAASTTWNNSTEFLKANGVVIAETEGLYFTNEYNNRALAIAINYPETSLGTYHGPQYLWLGGKNINYFVIPNVAAGSTITMGVESHKPTDARGVKLYVGYGNEGNKADDNLPSGAELAGPAELPTTYVEQTWTMPADATDTNVTVRNTNGCHIYFITVDDGQGAGIAGIEADDNAPAVYYNLQGVEVANPANGLYIKKQGNKATKVIVK